MAEPIGLAAGVLALATFAFKSSVILRDEIRDYHTQPRQVRDLLTELEGLVSVLEELSKTSDFSLDVDITALRLTLEQCRRSCDAVSLELRKYCSRSGLDKTSFRDWAKLKYSGGDGIDGFRKQLLGYKSTVTVALSFANLRVSAKTTEAVYACRDLIAMTTVDLEAHLEEIGQKLDTLSHSTPFGADVDKAVRQRMEEEQRNTEKGLEFCATLFQAIEGIQVEFFGEQSADRKVESSDSTSGMLLGEGLDGCMHHMRFTLAQLERHRKRITEGLGAVSAPPLSAEDRASLDRLRAEEKTLKHCLDFCSDVDAVLESQISNIENRAEGNDAIQIMVSTDGKPINGKNQGVGDRIKQAGGHFSNDAIQQVSQDFKVISIHHAKIRNQTPGRSIPRTDGDTERAQPKSPFGNRHGPGFTLAEHDASAAPAGGSADGSP